MPQRENTIQACLGTARLAPYLSAGQNDLAKAIELYEWNLQLGAAFQEVTMILEVAVRNAIDKQLKPWNIKQSRNSHNPTTTFNEEWIAHPAIPLRGLMTRHSAKAASYATAARSKRPRNHPRRQASISHDDLLAQLSFGTWPSILPHPNNPRSSVPKLRVWEEAIIHAFPNAHSGDAGIRQVGEPLKRLHNLRNRIAHGEQLLEVNVAARFGDVLRVLAFIDQDLADWCVDVSRVREVQKQRPKP